MRASRALLTALVALGLLAASTGRAQAATGTASISGTVTDSGGHTITTEDVCATAYPTESGDFVEGEPEYPSARTDASGDYTITGLAAGSYKVYFADCEGSARNDLPQYYDDQSEEESATTITLTEGQAQGGVDASLAQGTTISGHVYGGSGDSTPLEGICVDAYPTSGSYIYATYTQTGAGGAYTLTHVAPSVAYTVEFYDCRSSREYLTRYYDEASEDASATKVTSTLASPSSGIDAHLETGASISGTVTDAEGHPITTKDICVDVFPANPDGVYTENDYGEARTNASGQYTVGALAPGSYDVFFSDCPESTRNDAPQYYDHQASSTLADSITLSARQAQTGINASLEPATTISGHVYAGTGDSTPLQNVCVEAYPATNDADYYDDYSTAETNSEGAYTLTHIVPNVAYYVEFFDCGSTPEYIYQYYDGASNANQATAITPTTSPLTGIDAHLEKGASISGTVTDAEGHPITTKDICVDAESATSEYDYYGNATTDASGDYTITGLPAGSYKVYFFDCYDGARNDLSQYYDGASTWSAASPVVLSAGGAQTGIDAEMQPATTISGHVYAGAGTSTPLQDICVEAEPVSSDEDQFYEEADTSADGSYTIDHLTPSIEYRVSFSDCNNPRQYLTQYYNGASYSTATILTPTVATPATEVDANMENGASISGTVTDAEGHPITTGEICVSASPSSYLSYSENDYGYATTGASGEYTIGALAPGSYDVEFYDCSDSDTQRNDLPQYYDGQPTSSTAEPVTLTAMQVQTGIDASMQPATSISGHVYAGAGTSTPLDDICVAAFPAAADEADEIPVSNAYTAADGSYTLLHLAPSTGYKIEFYDCEDFSAYEAQFYDEASELATAKTVTPTASPTTGIDGHLLTNPLQVTITGGPARDAATNATESSFSFTARDTKATFECELDDKGFSSCTSPVETSALNGGAALADGTHTFSVEATDGDQTGPPTTVTWTVDTSAPTSTAGGSASAGETFSSDPGQSPSATTPVITEVTAPVAANITLTNEPATTPSENGYTVFGQQIDIAATEGDGTPVTATEAEPIALTFNLDAAEIPAGTKLAEITVLRNGSPASNCVTSGKANPDPCVSSRAELPGGGVKLTVLTTHCSLWNFAFTAGHEEHKEPGGTGEKEGSGSTEHTPGSTGGGSTSTGTTLLTSGGLGGVTQRAATPKPLTQAERLAKAIAACHKLKGHKRTKCIAAARKRYPLHKAKAHRKRGR